MFSLGAEWDGARFPCLLWSLLVDRQSLIWVGAGTRCHRHRDATAIVISLTRATAETHSPVT